MAKSTRKDAVVVQSTEWRCPNIRQHFDIRNTLANGALPVPCKDCHTVEVIRTEISVPLDLNTIQDHQTWITWDKSLNKENK